MASRGCNYSPHNSAGIARSAAPSQNLGSGGREGARIGLNKRWICAFERAQQIGVQGRPARFIATILPHNFGFELETFRGNWGGERHKVLGLSAWLGRIWTDRTVPGWRSMKTIQQVRTMFHFVFSSVPCQELREIPKSPQAQLYRSPSIAPVGSFESNFVA